ncbi:MAG: trimeric intracellular cation channel family protein [Gammaproteobacteria bacterium]|nr:trimeric intracellular cation channel family protein [Gammaproteobacteria bacterium]
MIDTFAGALNWFGVAVFATTGALVASRKQMDIVGFALLGTATGIGGGTIRDALLGIFPVFWIAHPSYLISCVLVSCATFFLAHIPQSRYSLLLRFDGIGLAIFAVTGTETALLAGAEPVVAIAMGVITATFGGMIRDILGGESPLILRHEIYVTAALVGAACFAALTLAGSTREIALISGFVLAAAIRLSALRWSWSLPRYRPREERPPSE